MTEETLIQPIRIEGDPVLRETCESVILDAPNVHRVVNELHATLNATEHGVGIAAPQIGHPIRIFVMGGNSTRPIVPKVTFINPVIVGFRGVIRKDTESCLSVPGVHARIDRHQKVRIKYFDEDLKPQESIFKGFFARIIQHEMDHMDGKEFYDHLKPDELAQIQFKIDKLRKGDMPSGVDYEYKLYEGEHE